MLKEFSIVALALFIAAIIFVPQPYFVQGKRVHESGTKTAITVSPLQFEEQTLDWGLTASHDQSGHELTGLNEVMGGGGCVFDFNNDGWQDIFVVGGSGQHRYYGKTAWWARAHGNSLWLNTGQSAFVDVTGNSNIPAIDWSMGCATGDLDNDGNFDLIVLTTGNNRVLRNNGDGTFSDVTDKTGLQHDNAWSLSASIADYNDDGLVDVYVSNFIHYEKEAKVYERASGFLDPVHAAFDPILYDSQANKLYENRGGFQFVEKADEMGVANVTGRSKAARWLDVNQDRKADLLVLNSGGSPNQLFINRWPKPFSSESSQYRVESSVGSNNLAVGDIDNDHDADILMTRSSGTAPMLLLNNVNKVAGAGVFDHTGLTDLAWELGLASDTVLYQEGWGLSLADFNNDGWLDVYSANGLLTIDEDSGHVATGQQDQVWINNAGVFEVQVQTDITSLPGRSVVSGDFDNDGKQDLLVTHNNGNVRLLVNTTDVANAWLSVDLKDKDGAGVNAVVNVHAGDEMYTRTAFSKTGFLSQAGHRLHFGLAGAGSIEYVKVTWGDGAEQIVDDVDINSIIVVEKGADKIEFNSNKVTSSDYALPDYYPVLTTYEKELFVQAVHAARQDPRATEILLHTFADSESHTRLMSLGLLADMQAGAAYLSVLKKALSDDAMAVRLMALEHVRVLELEQSVDWLIAALSDEKVPVQCKAAEVLTYYYREEEAVIYRKYLAVPHLVRSLEHPNPRVKICATKALAEAERYRAVTPLIALVHDENEEVQNHAITALGFLRDTKAMEPLAVLVRSRSQSAATTAHAMIALKRLNYSLLNELLGDYVDPDNTREQNIENLEIIDALLAIQEGIVFDTADIMRYRSALVGNICNADQFVDVCRRSYPPARLLAEPASAVENDFELWASGLGINTNKILTDIIKNKSADVNKRLDAMRYLADKKVNYVETLLLRYVADEDNEIRHEFVPLLSRYDGSSEVRENLWSVLRDRRQSFDIRFQSAKVLASGEAFAVISQLTGLTWLNPEKNQ